MKYKVIAVDYDNTITTMDNFPHEAPIDPKAVNVLQRFHAMGGKIIIWTCRHDKTAEQARKAIEMAGIPYDAFNDQLPYIIDQWGCNARKAWAEWYIDDKAFPIGLWDALGRWDWVEQQLF